MKYKYIIVVLISIFNMAVVHAQIVQYVMVDKKVIIDQGDSIFAAKVYAMSDVGFKLGAGQLYFDYDTTVFGGNIVQNQKLTILVDSTCLLGQQITSGPFSLYGQFITNDNAANRFSFSWQSNFSDGCLAASNFKVYITKLFEIHIDMTDSPNSIANAVCFETAGPFIDQTYTICGPQNCDIGDCIVHPGLRLSGDIFHCDDCRIVTKVSDYGLGSLRMAMECAGPGDSVLFDVVINNQQIALDTPAISTNASITLYAQDGQNITLTSVDANNVSTLIESHDLLKIIGLELIGKSDNSLIFEAKGNGSFEFERATMEKLLISTP